jgi:hypothetical protein
MSLVRVLQLISRTSLPLTSLSRTVPHDPTIEQAWKGEGSLTRSAEAKNCPAWCPSVPATAIVDHIDLPLLVSRILDLLVISWTQKA